MPVDHLNSDSTELRFCLYWQRQCFSCDEDSAKAKTREFLEPNNILNFIKQQPNQETELTPDQTNKSELRQSLSEQINTDAIKRPIRIGFPFPSKTATVVKTWNLQAGNPSTFSAYLNGKLELKGSTFSSSAYAEGNAGGAMFNRQADLLRATASLNAPVSSDLTTDMNLTILIPSLATVNSPSVEAENVLQNLAFNSQERIASTAQLALGAMAHNLAQTSPQRANKIVEKFLQKLQTAGNDEQTRQYLLVLGNAGSVQALKAIAQLTSAPNPSIRAAAVTALRWIQDNQVDTLLTKALSSDIDDGVRLEAAVALGFREMNKANFQQQKHAFLSDKAFKVRLAALKNLWQAHEAFPEVRQLVKQAAQNDVSKDVQEAAANIVKMYPQGRE